MENEQKFLFDIIRATVFGEQVPILMDNVDYSLMHSYAGEHGLIGFLWVGFKDVFLPPEIKQKYERQKLYYAENTTQLSRLLSILNTAGFSAMPLDGAAIRTIYPEAVFRCGKNLNILVKHEERDKIRYLIEKKDFTCTRITQYADFYSTAQNVCIMLTECDGIYNGNIDLWAKATLTKNSNFIYALPINDRYICALVRLKTQLNKGFGSAKFLCDIFMLIFAFDSIFDNDYIKNELDILGLGYFETQVKDLYKALFLNNKTIKIDDDFIAMIFKPIEKSLPPKYISPEKIALLKKTKRILFFVGIFSATIAAVVIFLIFSNAFDRTNMDDSSSFNADSNVISSSDEVKNLQIKNGYYTGQVNLSKQPNGNGKLEFFNGDVYDGQFTNGLRNGKGTTVFKLGGKYTGNYVNDIMSGDGILYTEKNDVISGNFSGSEITGVFSVIYSDSSKYDGPLQSGFKNGEGVFVWKNGDKYVGSFLDDFRSGYGEYTYANGSVYKGMWIKGVQTGKGIFNDEHGIYDGNFLNGKFEGTGKYAFNNGDFYDGQWKNGLQNGTGKLISGAETLEGTFVNGIFHGNGKKTFANGDIVKGNFVNGKLEGEADYYYKSLDYWKKVLYKDGEIIKYLN